MLKKSKKFGQNFEWTILTVFSSFQNLDDGDIRDLGVGYYNFSADESTRQQQMSLLDTLRYAL